MFVSPIAGIIPTEATALADGDQLDGIDSAITAFNQPFGQCFDVVLQPVDRHKPARRVAHHRRGFPRPESCSCDHSMPQYPFQGSLNHSGYACITSGS